MDMCNTVKSRQLTQIHKEEAVRSTAVHAFGKFKTLNSSEYL